MSPGPLLSTLELHCRRHAAMLVWYRALTGAEVEFRDELQCWLRSADGWRLLLLDTQWDERPREVAGVAGLAFEYPSLAALAAAWKSLAARAIRVERAVRNGVATSLVYRDPDGNPVTLRYVLPVTERPRTTSGPLGEEFDPADLLDDLA